MDNIMLIEKTYSLFINDFWFDYLKPNNICNRKKWGNFIGSKFFEPFLESIFNNAFKYNKRISYLSIDLLKFTEPGKTEVELADFYIRDRNEIILAEAKSNYLPIVNGYKEVNLIQDYRNLNLAKFYKDYGLTQLVTTIKLFQKYKPQSRDKELQIKGKVKIYPLLIVNDPIFSSGYAFLAFRRKFIQLLKSKKIDIENSNHRIMPLSIINVSELQDIEQSLKERNQTIFNILRMFFSMTNNITYDTRYNHLKTLTHVIDKIINNDKIISKRIRTFTWLGFNRK